MEPSKTEHFESTAVSGSSDPVPEELDTDKEFLPPAGEKSSEGDHTY